MGKSLFRFRKISDYSINELMNNELVGTTNDLLNDPYDCKFYYNKEAIISFLNNNKNIYDDFLKNNKFPIDSVEFLTHWYAEEETEKRISKAFYTISFAEKNNQEIMWSHYADEGKGFALEYDEIDIYWALRYKRVTEMDSYKRRTIGIFKVRYPKKRTDMSDYLIKIFEQGSSINGGRLDLNDVLTYKNMFGMTKRIITEKNRDWSYEKEHRLIWPNEITDNKGNFISGHKCILSNIKPHAIYVGENCSKKDKLVLYSIAKAKDIKLYEMCSTNTTQTYLLECKEVSNESRDRAIENLQFDKYDAFRDFGQTCNSLGKDVFKNLSKNSKKGI